MKNQIRIRFVLMAMALPGFSLAASIPGTASVISALPQSGTVPTSRQDCWIDHVQVQPGHSPEAGSANVSQTVAIGSRETSGHPGAEHRKNEPKGSTPCSEQFKRRPATTIKPPA